MTGLDTMKLTLGQAAKEVGKSKTALSNAIKNGRLSAGKSEGGSYEIDPAELFRVYPPKRVNKGQGLTELDPKNRPKTGVNEQVLTAQLTGHQKLLEEKDKQIERLIREKDKIEELLHEQTQQAKRITLLLENKSTGGGEWEKAIKALEDRIANQEEQAKKQMEAKEKARETAMKYKKAFEEEKNKSFWQRLFGS